MAGPAVENIPLSAVSPQFLNANSTSHTWPFGAFAELIDNAYDPDVNAKHLWINWTQMEGLDCLTFMDNGNGMDYDKMHKMLSLGFSDKKTVKGHAPVGLYGNGFKSGSMRLGKDVIIFSKAQNSMTIGLLSQTYLAAIRAQNVIVPIVTFRQDGNNKFSAVTEHRASLNAILEHSLFETEADLLRELEVIDSPTGTRIIIWNLRSTSSESTEFDFFTDRYDIRIPRVDSADVPGDPNQVTNLVPTINSLRAYSSILYLKPRMQIIIRGQKVRTQLLAKSLAYTKKDRYAPKFQKKPFIITFGYNTKNKEEYGLMMYHKNRLIRAYEHVRCQHKAKGVGVIGIINCDFLKPTHNKQDFDHTEEYRKIKYNLGVKLEEYSKETDFRKKNRTVPIEDIKESPDQSWAQCNTCEKWRKLPDGIDADKLPLKWFCHLNPDPQYRNCQVGEELEDSEDEQPYPKTYKQQDKNKKQQQGQYRQQNTGDTGSTPSASPTPSTHSGTQGSDETSFTPPTSTPLSHSDHRLTSLVISNVHSLSTPARSKKVLKRSLFTPWLESKAVKMAKMNSRQNSIPEAADATVSLEPLSPISKGALVDGSMETEVMTMAASLSSSTQTEVEPKVKAEEEDEWGRDGSVAEDDGASAEQAEPQQGQVRKDADTEGGVQKQLQLLDNQQDQLMEMLQEAAQERDRYREQVKTAIRDRDRYRELVETATQEKDRCVEQMKTAIQDRDQYREQVETATQEKDRCVEQMKTAIQDRDRYREQVETATQEKNRCVEQMKTAIQDRDRYREQVETATQEKDRYRKPMDQLSYELKASNMRQEKHGQVMEREGQEGEVSSLQVDSILRDLDRNNKERDELKSKLESMEVERGSLSSQCEQLKRELEDLRRGTWSRASGSGSAEKTLNECNRPDSLDETQRLRNLRLNVSRLLVTIISELELDQVNYDSTVIDEILEQFLDGISSTGSA